MKKLFLVSALALFGAMNAQTSKGTWMVSGKTELGFNSTETKVEFQGANVAESKTTSFTLNPAASYFVIDNLAIGLGLGFNSSKTDDDKSNTFSVMPQATYFFTVDGNIKPYVEAGVGYGTIDLNVKMCRPVPKDKELLAIGSVINLSKNLAISEGKLLDEAGKLYAHATATCMIIRP